jgi:hypothetical protein
MHESFSYSGNEIVLQLLATCSVCLKALSIFNYAIQAPLEVVQEIAYCMIKRL